MPRTFPAGQGKPRDHHKPPHQYRNQQKRQIADELADPVLKPFQNGVQTGGHIGRFGHVVLDRDNAVDPCRDFIQPRHGSGLDHLAREGDDAFANIDAHSVVAVQFGDDRLDPAVDGGVTQAILRSRDGAGRLHRLLRECGRGKAQEKQSGAKHRYTFEHDAHRIKSLPRICQNV